MTTDPSQWWPIIPQDHGIDHIENTLISALHRTSVTAINDDSNNLLMIIQIFENYPWAVFRRLALYLLAIHPKVSQLINTTHLKNHELFQNFPSEYYLLLERAFNQLQVSEQTQILDWFNDVPDDNPDHWQLHWLTAIKHDLPEVWKSRYDQLIQSLGEPNEFIYHSPIETYAFWGDGSPKTTNELLDMSTYEIFEYLKDWQPSDGLGTISKRGLGFQLKDLVSNSPDKLAVEAAKFITVSPTYINFFLSGLRDAISNKKKFLWHPVLELCTEIISLLSESPSPDILEDWSWTRAEIADLLRQGFETDAVEFVHRDLTWSILVALINQAPNPDDEYGRVDHNMSPLELSYNTFRGRTLHAIMQYLFWVQTHLRRLSDPSIQFEMSFNMIPEIIFVLEKYILDNSLAVKAVFGRYILWLDLLNPEWLAKNLKDIFVDDDIVWSAAWSAYITTCKPYDHNFSLLKNEYLRAVNTIDIHDIETRTRRDTQYLKNLIWHIMVFYERGLLDIDEPEGVLQLFYRVASDKLCAYAMQNLGQRLENSTEPISEEIILRFDRLWRYRLGQMRIAPQVHQHELLAFSWWFVSNKVDPEWSIEQLKQVLNLTGDSEVVLADDIVAQLAVLVDKMPQDVVECLDYIVDRTKELWQIDIWQKDIRTILTISLKSSNLFAQQKSSAFVNKLAARGYLAFRDLLKP